MSRRPPKPPQDGTDSLGGQRAPARRRPKFAKTQVGGGNMFSHDASKLRDAIPNAEEGDALFDQLFDGGASSEAPSNPAPKTEERETETRIQLPVETEERETLFFERGPDSSNALTAAPESAAVSSETATVAVSAMEDRETLAIDESPEPPMSVPADAIIDLAPVFRVDALPSDRGSTEELGLDDVEIVGDGLDPLDGFRPGRDRADDPAIRAELSESEHPTARAADTDGVSDAVTRHPESELPPSTQADGDEPPSFRSRGEFAVVRLPALDEPAELPIPQPARSIPFALVPQPRISEDGFEVVVDEDAFLDELPLIEPEPYESVPGSYGIPPSRESLVAARESVAGWLSSVEPSLARPEQDEFVLSLDDVEDVPPSTPSALPVPSARKPLDSIEIFSTEPADLEAAVVSLVERGERKAWLDRAKRLADQAPTDNAAARASALLVVSELFAIGGEAAEAEKLSLEALQLMPTSPMIQRQVRGFLVARRAWPEVIEQLTREARTAPTDVSRAHAALLAAEIARLKVGDVDLAARMVERAGSACPEDARPSLARWVANAANHEAVFEPPKGEAEATFAAAEGELAALRTNGADGGRATSRFGRLLAARAGLRRRDAATAVSVLLDVGKEPGLGGAAAWLAAVLGAPNAELRESVAGALDRARSGSHSAMARRLAVAHAVERGDVKSVGAAVRAGDGLAPADRLLLAATLPPEETPRFVKDLVDTALAAHPDERPLIAAAAAFLGHPLSGALAVGDERGKRRVAVARHLAGLRDELPIADAHVTVGPTVAALAELEPDDGLVRAFALERRFVDGRQEQLFAELAGGGPEERALAQGLFAELTGRVDAMTAALEPIAPNNLAALRMLVTHATAERAALTLERAAADRADDMASRLLIEAAHRVRFDGPRAEVLWSAAYERDDRSLLPPLFGFAGALRTGVRATARQWLTRCGFEPVQEHILEALRLAPAGSPERTTLLGEAHRRAPDDMALRGQYEAAGGGRGDRASWLEDRISGGEGVDFAAEAALLYELDGDLASASRVVSAADASVPHVDVIARRLALRGHGVEAVATRLSSLLLRADSPDERRDWLTELARLEWYGRGDKLAASKHFLGIVQGGFADLLSLVEAARFFLDYEDPEGQAAVEFGLARIVGDREAVAHAMVAVRRANASGQPALALDAARIAATASRRGTWSLRQLAALAHVRRDFDGLWRAACDLAERTSRPLERAALLCRAAEAAFAAGDDASASALLVDVFSAWPRHPVARLLRASVLERSGAILEAAIAFEELAGMTRSRRDRASRCYKAATLWLASNDPRAAAEGQRLLEAACDLDPEHAAAFERLQAIYLAGGARMELAELLSQRVRTVSDVHQRGELEVLRGRMLAEAGASGEAKLALAASLKLRPDDVVAWRAYADVALAEQDGEAAEQALLQLGRLVTDPKERVDVYLRLGDVYSRLRPNHERARRAYREAEKLDPTRVDVRERYIELQAAMGDPKGAIAAQRALCEEAKTALEICSRTIALAWLYERSRELSEAERILLDLRRHHPFDAQVLRSLHAFYLRQSKRGLADGLLERIPYDVGRMIVAGRIDDGVFGIARAVSELRGRTDAVAMTDSLSYAIHGGDSRIGAAGARVASKSLDDLLAPEVWSPELRELLDASGHLLDAATPFDSRAVRSRPLTQHEGHVARARAIAAEHGLHDIDFVVANALPATILPVSVSPAVFCVGAPLLDPGNAGLFDVALHRAALLVRTRTAALARTAPIDQWAVVAAFLRMHAPDAVPQGADPAKVAEAEARMRAAAPDFAPDARLRALAGHVLETIGPRGSSLGAAALAWAWRVAAIAAGDVALVLDAMALAAGPASVPAVGDARVRWLGKHPEARELYAFLVSDAHLEARARLNVLVPLRDGLRSST